MHTHLEAELADAAPMGVVEVPGPASPDLMQSLPGSGSACGVDGHRVGAGGTDDGVDQRDQVEQNLNAHTRSGGVGVVSTKTRRCAQVREESEKERERERVAMRTIDSPSTQIRTCTS